MRPLAATGLMEGDPFHAGSRHALPLLFVHIASAAEERTMGQHHPRDPIGKIRIKANLRRR